MLITRNILNKALEDKMPLFHDGDYIDDDVLYDLFYAQPILKDLPNGKKGLRTLIPRSDRDILCAELNGYISHSPKDVFDKIYYTLRCKLCNKTFPVHITKGQIINRTFKISNHINITVNPDRYYLFTNALRELYNMKYGNVHNTYVCKSCVEKFVSP